MMRRILVGLGLIVACTLPGLIAIGVWWAFTDQWSPIPSIVIYTVGFVLFLCWCIGDTFIGEG